MKSNFSSTFNGLLTLTVFTLILSSCTAFQPTRINSIKSTNPDKQGTPDTDSSETPSGPANPSNPGPIIPTNPSTPSDPSPPMPSPTNPGASHPSYVPIVGINGKITNFREAQNPQALSSRNLEGVQIKVLEYEAISNSQGTAEQLKFFLPPGTVAFDANFYHYLANEDGKGAMKLYAPPTTSIGSITPAMTYDLPGGKKDYSQILNKLISREEVLYYTSGGSANFMVISSPDKLSPALSPGGYVYLNFRHPGGQFQRSLWKVYVKADCYDKWYNSQNTKWDSNANPTEGVEHYCN